MKLTAVSSNFSGNLLTSNLTGLPDLFTQYSLNLQPLSLRSSLSTLLALNTSLYASLIPLEAIQSIRRLAVNLSGLVSAVTYGALEFAAQAKGFCNSSLALCVSDEECSRTGGGRCVEPGMGYRRCVRGWFPSPGEWGWQNSALESWYPVAAGKQMSGSWWLGPFAKGPSVGTVTLGGRQWCNT